MFGLQQELSKMFDENLKKQFFIMCKFSNHDINKFTLLSRKGVYSCEYINDWEKFSETSLPEKISLQSSTHGRYY